MVLPSFISHAQRSRTRYCFYIVSLITLSILFMKIYLKQTIVFSSGKISYSEHGSRIPKLVHFVVGQEQDKKTSSFTFFNYLVFLAARRHIRPMKLFVHYHHEPNTFWWNQTKRDAEIDMTLIKVRFVTKIFNRSIDHYAHRSDVIRLEAILQYGGIYLDTDSLTLRSFDPLLNLNDVVLAYENDDKNLVASGVILAKRNAAFVRRWYDAYRSFDGKCWNCHSVVLVGRLALQYPNEVTVLATETFYRPSWNEPNQFFESNDYNFTRNYAVHLWNTVNKEHLNKVNPDFVLKSNRTFEKMLRQAIDTDTFLKLKQIFIKGY